MEEGEKLYIIWSGMNSTKDLIFALYYKTDSGWVDDKMKEYYYSINDMCCEILDKNKMEWQKDGND